MTELEYEKACRGTLAPVANEFAWGSPALLPTKTLINAGTAEELPGEIGANVTAGSSPTIIGPTRVGMYATSVSSRALSGATYYGIMDMTGNLKEYVVHAGVNPKFTGRHGTGVKIEYNQVETLQWPGEVIPLDRSRGISYRGGWYGAPATVSFRGEPLNVVTDDRFPSDGGRGVRTAPL